MENCIFTIYVNDLIKSRDFYSFVFQSDPEIDLDNETLETNTFNQFVEFHFDDWVLCIRSLAHFQFLFSSNDLNVNISPATSTVSRTELFFYTEDKEEFLKRIEMAGGRILVKSKQRVADQWIENISYGLDPDGNILAFCG